LVAVVVVVQDTLAALVGLLTVVLEVLLVAVVVAQDNLGFMSHQKLVGQITLASVALVGVEGRVAVLVVLLQLTVVVAVLVAQEIMQLETLSLLGQLQVHVKVAYLKKRKL
jgi:hypothetical protein